MELRFLTPATNRWTIACTSDEKLAHAQAGYGYGNGYGYGCGHGGDGTGVKGQRESTGGFTNPSLAPQPLLVRKLSPQDEGLDLGVGLRTEDEWAKRLSDRYGYYGQGKSSAMNLGAGAEKDVCGREGKGRYRRMDKLLALEKRDVDGDRDGKCHHNSIVTTRPLPTNNDALPLVIPELAHLRTLNPAQPRDKEKVRMSSSSSVHDNGSPNRYSHSNCSSEMGSDSDGLDLRLPLQSPEPLTDDEEGRDEGYRGPRWGGGKGYSDKTGYSDMFSRDLPPLPPQQGQEIQLEVHSDGNWNVRNTVADSGWEVGLLTTYASPPPILYDPQSSLHPRTQPHLPNLPLSIPPAPVNRQPTGKEKALRHPVRQRPRDSAGHEVFDSRLTAIPQALAEKAKKRLGRKAREGTGKGESWGWI
jgi:hypothetical protein